MSVFRKNYAFFLIFNLTKRVLRDIIITSFSTSARKSRECSGISEKWLTAERTIDDEIVSESISVCEKKEG